MKDINVLPAVWGEDEEQLVSWDPVVQRGPVTVPAPVPTPACQHQYQVFRKARTTKIATNMATEIGRQSFYNKVTTKAKELPVVKRATVSVGNSFQSLQVPEFPMFGDSACGADPEISPSGMASPLTVKGSGVFPGMNWVVVFL